MRLCRGNTALLGFLLLVAHNGVEAFSTSSLCRLGRSTSPAIDQLVAVTTSTFSRNGAASTSPLFSQSAVAATTLPVNGVGTTTTTRRGGMSRPLSLLVKAGIVTYLTGFCVMLAASLIPQNLLYKVGLISKIRKERWALETSQFCARFMRRLIPFCRIRTIGESNDPNPEPTVWVCNHASMLDVFMLLIADKRLRGSKKRPIKIVYWEGLEANPFTKLLFRQAGFIPVSMLANKAGEDNQYDPKSFKQLLKMCKEAFAEGFDIGILPEGQLNPTPEKGLLPIFTGAQTLARMSKRPIRMIALHGVNQMWPAGSGLDVTGNLVKIRNYQVGRVFKCADEFKATFEKVVGHFGATGEDLPDLDAWLTGKAWKEKHPE